MVRCGFKNKDQNNILYNLDWTKIGIYHLHLHLENSYHCEYLMVAILNCY